MVPIVKTKLIVVFLIILVMILIIYSLVQKLNTLILGHILVQRNIEITDEELEESRKFVVTKILKGQ